MSLEVTLHRAAYEELVEASAWYESKRSGLALEFIAEIERCFSLAAEHPFQFASVREGIRRIVAKHFPYACTTVWKRIVSSSWAYFTVREIRLFGQAGPDLCPSGPAIRTGCVKHYHDDLNARRPVPA